MRRQHDAAVKAKVALPTRTIGFSSRPTPSSGTRAWSTGSTNG